MILTESMKMKLTMSTIVICLFAACSTPTSRVEWAGRSIVAAESEDMRRIFLNNETLLSYERRGVCTVWLPNTFGLGNKPFAEVSVNTGKALKDVFKIAFPASKEIGGSQVRLISRNSIIQTPLYWKEDQQPDSVIVSPGDILILQPRR